MRRREAIFCDQRVAAGIFMHPGAETRARAYPCDATKRSDVEALFAGPPDAVEALCAACWRGPVQARVDKVEVAEADPAALAGPGFRQIATR